jgi:hypothetical protein
MQIGHAHLLVEASGFLHPGQRARLLGIDDPQRVLRLLEMMEDDGYRKRVDAPFLLERGSEPADAYSEPNIVFHGGPVRDKLWRMTQGDTELGRLVEALVADIDPRLMSRIAREVDDDDWKTAPDRLRALADELVYEGVVEVPDNVVRVDFGGNGVAKVRQRRDFRNSDPVKLFYERFGDTEVTRKESERADDYLHGILIRAGRLEEVIPKYYGYTATERRRIERAKRFFSGCRTASHALGVPNTTILAIWRRAEARETRLIEAADQYDTATAAAEALGSSVTTVIRKWRAAGVGEHTKNRNYNGDPVAVFKELYGDRTFKSRQELRNADEPMWKALQREGKLGEVIPSSYNLTQDEKNWIVAFYQNVGGNTRAVERELGRSRKTAGKIWKEAGLPGYREYQRMIKAGTQDEVKPLMAEYIGIELEF